MKILNLQKCQQNKETLQLIKEFVQNQSITLLLTLYSQKDDKQALKVTIKYYLPIVNKIYAEVLQFQLFLLSKNIDKNTINLTEEVEILMLSLIDLLDEIESQLKIYYDKPQVEEVFSMMSMPRIEVDERINDSCCNSCLIQ